MKKLFIGGLLLAGIIAFAGTCTLTNYQLTQIGNYDTYGGEILNNSGTNFLQHNVVVAFVNSNNTVVDTQTATPCLRTLQNGYPTYFSVQSAQSAGTTVNAVARLAYDSSLHVGTAATGSGTLSNLAVNSAAIVNTNTSTLTVTGTFQNTDGTLLQAPNACAVAFNSSGNVVVVGLDQSMSDLNPSTSDTFNISMTVPSTSGSVSYVNIYVDGLKNGVPIMPISSTNLQVSLGASMLAFISQPGGGYANYANTAWTQQPSVALENSNGTVNTTAPSTYVSLAISSASTGYGYGSLYCTSGNSVYTTSGYAYFSGCYISQSTAIQYTYYLTASATINGVTVTVTSNPFYIYAGTPTPVATATPVGTATPTVTPGPAHKLVFTTEPSAAATHAVAFAAQPVVKLEDAAGNVMTSDSASSVTFTLVVNSGSGVLAGCTGAVTLVSGVATFTGCNITLAGNYQLSASSSLGVGIVTDVSSPPTVVS